MTDKAKLRWPWIAGFFACIFLAGMSFGGGIYQINTNPGGIWWGIGFAACGLTTFRIIKQRSILPEQSAQKLWLWSWGMAVLAGIGVFSLNAL